MRARVVAIPAVCVLAAIATVAAAANIVGSERSQTLRGTNGADVIRAGSGDDRVLGRGGPDMLFGQAGDDRLDGGPQADRLDGGAGRDVLLGAAGDDTLLGRTGEDRLDGGGDRDRIDAGSGDDVVLGGAGMDTLIGATGNDLLTGGPGVDRLLGGAGDDLIVSRDGVRDVVNCGSGSDFVVRDRVDDVAPGCEAERSDPQDPMTVAPVPPAPPVLAAVGDIACDPASARFNGGAGTTNNCREAHVADLVDKAPAADLVLTLGDTQYEDGSYAQFVKSFDRSWGHLKSRIRPAVGNHEYKTPHASGYFRYFGPAAGDPSKGYYSYDIGAWHVVVLNSNCSKVGGCSANAPQGRWLRADLAAHPTACTLAYWHHPLFSSGSHGGRDSMSDAWRALHEAGAELVLAGHDHIYERFAPMDADGVRDEVRGIRQFVVGSGGKNHTDITAVQPNSEVRDASVYGLLKLTLRPDGYDWRFVPEGGQSAVDSGSAACH